MAKRISNLMRKRSQDLRNSATTPEQKLWAKLKEWKAQGFHFRRQQTIENFIFDFACLRQKLLIELDGYSHDLQQQVTIDENKNLCAKNLGYRLLRFNNDEVMKNMDGVLRHIEVYLNPPTQENIGAM